MWSGYNRKEVYTASQLVNDDGSILQDAIKDVEIIETKSGYYYNCPASFDIETSSFISGVDENNNAIKAATMYIWQLGINGVIIYGRTWGEFIEVYECLLNELNLSNELSLIIYVHNLGYEFQFIRKLFEWKKVFAIKTRRPVYAATFGIEFRCSFFLSNYSLEYLGRNLLHKYPVQKMVGDLDYSKIRHSATPLTEKELLYCFNDVRVVMSYIQEKIESDGDISKIPLTNTGYVRNYCREECFFQGVPESDLSTRRKIQLDYKAIMKSLQVTSQEEYDQMQRAFMGGFTHASALYSGELLENVGSADFTSSYPYAMLTKGFPIAKGTYIGSVENNLLFNNFLKKYCCIFDVKFKNLKPAVEFENVISLSRCKIWGKSTINNGRVVSADELMTTLTELDYDTITKFYTWDSITVTNMRIYQKGYLPRPLILAVLDLYEKKTVLKGVEGKEIEYLVSKNMINAAFGMMVTAIVRDEFQYKDDEWLKAGADVTSQLDGYNRNFNRFLYYGWGIYVTAIARHNLFTGIYEFGKDYVYSDTDSIKGINFQDHEEYFKTYNQQVITNLLNMCNYYKIPFSKCQPKTKKGETKLIGVWDIEEGYKRFKTVGAKRYMFEEPNGTLSMTVSGLNKKHAIPWLLQDNNNDHDMIFEKFGDGLYVPAGHTGKMTMTYIDNPISGEVTDYLGVTNTYSEKSCTHMEPQSYFMCMIGDYLNFLEGVQHVEY